MKWALLEAADRILFIDGGRIIEEGTPDHFFDHPTQERTKAFLSKILLTGWTWPAR